MKPVTTAQYRRLRTIFLRTARSYRFGSVWGPADAAKLREEQGRLAALRMRRNLYDRARPWLRGEAQA